MLQNFLYFFVLLNKLGKLIWLNISKRKDSIEQHHGSKLSHLAENIKRKTDFFEIIKRLFNLFNFGIETIW